MNCEVRGNFLRRDDPKLTALLQQAELLSSLAVKACSENRNQSSEDAWKVLSSLQVRSFDNFLFVFLYLCIDVSLKVIFSYLVIKELQNYLIRTQEAGTLCSFSEMDFLLDNFEGVLEDFRCVDKEIQLSKRQNTLISLMNLFILLVYFVVKL